MAVDLEDSLATSKKEKFAMEFVKNGGNAKQACLDAGYAESTASKQSYAIKTDPYVSKRIYELIQDDRESKKTTKENILSNLYMAANYLISDFAHIKNTEDFATLTPEQQSCIEGFSYDRQGNLIIKFVDKSKARNELARYLELFNDNKFESNIGSINLFIQKDEMGMI